MNALEAIRLSAFRQARRIVTKKQEVDRPICIVKLTAYEDGSVLKEEDGRPGVVIAKPKVPDHVLDEGWEPVR